MTDPTNRQQPDPEKNGVLTPEKLLEKYKEYIPAMQGQDGNGQQTEPQQVDLTQADGQQLYEHYFKGGQKPEQPDQKQQPTEREQEYYQLSGERQELQREKNRLQEEGSGVNYHRLQDVSGRLKVIEDQIEELKPEGAGIRLVNAVNGFVQGASEVPVGMLQGIATTAKWMDKKLGTNFQEGDVDEQFTYQLGQRLRNIVKNHAPTDPVLQEEFTQQLAQGLGSFLGFAGGGIASRLLTGSQKAGQAFAVGAAGFGGAGGAYEEAKEKGASEEDAQLAAKWGFIPGVVQVSNTALRVLNRWDKAYGGRLKESLARKIVEAGKSGINEALVESLGQVGFNKIAQEIYDAERPLLEGIGQSASVGGGAGFLSDMILTGLGGRRARMNRSQQRAQAEQQQGEQIVQSEIDKREPIEVGTYDGRDVKIQGYDEAGDPYIEIDGEQKLVSKDQVEDIETIPPEEQVAAEFETAQQMLQGQGEQAGTETQPEQQEMEDRMVVDPQTGDYLYPGDAGYEQAVQKVDEVSNKVTNLVVGTGRQKRNAKIQQQPDGSFTVLGTEQVDEEGGVVSVPISELTGKEVDQLVNDLTDELKAKGDYVIDAFPTDPSDPSSPMEVFISPAEGQEQEGAEIESDSETETETNEFDGHEVLADGPKISVLNPEGQEVGKQSPYYQPVLEDYFAGTAGDYSGLPRVTDDNQDVTEENFTDEVARYSENPVEIAEAYKMELANQEDGQAGAAKQIAIAEDLAASRVPTSDLQGRGIDSRIVYAQYAQRNADTDIAQRAEYLSDQLGMDVTIDDIIDFIREHPGGPRTALNQKSEKVQQLEDRFAEVTGVEITSSLADALVENGQPVQGESEFIEPDTDVAQQAELEEMSDEDLAQLEQQLIEAEVQREEIERINRQAETATEQEIEAIEIAVENAESEAEALKKLEEYFDFDRKARELTSEQAETTTEEQEQTNEDQDNEVESEAPGDGDTDTATEVESGRAGDDTVLPESDTGSDADSGVGDVESSQDANFSDETTEKSQPEPGQQQSLTGILDQEAAEETTPTDEDVSAADRAEESQDETETTEPDQQDVSGEAEQADTEEQQTTQDQPEEKIEDFGEKIGGSRKDEYQRYSTELDNISNDDLATKPLSQVFPEPNFDQLVEDGVLTRSAAIFIKINRDTIARSKPRKKYKKARWVEQAREIVDMMKQAVDGDLDMLMEVHRKVSDSPMFRDYRSLERMFTESGWPKESFNPGKARIREVGKDGASAPRGAKPFYITDGAYIQGEFDTYSEAMDAVYDIIDKKNQRSSKTKFDVYSRRGEDTFFLAKKLKARKFIIVKDGFTSAKDAREYRKNNQDELETIYTEMRKIPEHRKAYNESRIGEDYREGRDVTTHQFQDTFGFRAGEFGNWVNQSEAQENLNDTYDALMDLANVLNVDPKALSLNGELAMAWGARGRGGVDAAAAHYESGRIVINLTKKQGPGSLAHEWWHALDNYFARMDGKNMSFMTEAEKMMGRRDGQPLVVRREMVDQFRSVMDAIGKSDLKKRSKELDKLRTKDYWGTDIEMSARAFEWYVRHRLAAQGKSSDYLVNLLSEDNYGRPEAYPYPNKTEAREIAAAFDEFFTTIEQKTDENENVALYSLVEESTPTSRIISKRTSAEHRNQVRNAINKITREWANDDFVNVVDTIHDLPEYLSRRFIKEGSERQISGVFTNNAVYIVADNAKTVDDAKKTLFHETFGHLGIRSMTALNSYNYQDFQGRLAGILGDVHASFKDDLGYRQIVDNYNLDLRKPEHRMVAAEEFLARSAEGDLNPSLVDKIVKFVNDLMKQLGFRGKPLTKADVLAMLRDSRDLVEGDALAHMEGDGSHLRTAFYSFNDATADDIDPSDADLRMRLQPGDNLDDHASTYGRRWDNIIRKFQNAGIFAKRTLEGVEAEGGIVTDQNDFVQDENLARGRKSEQIRRFERGLKKDLIESMRAGNREKGIKHQDYHYYLYARHAKEVNEKFLEENPSGGPAQSGMTTKKAKELMDEFADRDILPELREAASIVDQILDENLKKQLAYGLISPAKYGKLKRQYDHYVPLRGFADFMDMDPTLYVLPESRKGRRSEAGDILSYVMGMAETTILRGERNLVKQRFLKFVEDNYDRTDLFEIQNVYWMDTGKIDADTGKKKYLAVYEQPSAEELLTGKVVRELDSDVMKGTWEDKDPFVDPEVRVMVKGKPVVVDLKEPHIAEWLSGADMDYVGKFLSKLEKYMSYLRNAYITYSPEFTPRNFFRDGFTAAFHVATDFDAATAAKIINPARLNRARKAVWQALRHDNYDTEMGKSLNKYLVKGTISGYFQLSPLKKVSKDLKNRIDNQRRPWERTKEFGRQIDDYMQAYTSTAENMVRFSTFDYLLNNEVTNPKTGKPYTEKQAASYAKNLTVNFDRKGSWGSVIGSFYLFYGATTQGIARQFEPFTKGNSTRRKVRAAGTAAVMAGMGYAATEVLRYGLGPGEDDEHRVDKINDFTIGHRFLVPNFFSENEDDMISIPLPYGLNNYWAAGVFANKISAGAMTAEDAAIKMASNAYQSFNPIGGQISDTGPLYSGFKTLLPEVFVPPFEMITNENFTGRSIRPEQFPYGPKKPQSENFKYYTSEWSKAIARAINTGTGGDQYEEGLVSISPNDIEFLVSTYTGGAGYFLLSTIETAEAAALAAATDKEFTEDEARRIPGVRIFFSSVPRGSARSSFYANRDRLEQMEWKHKQLLENEGPEAAEAYWQENQDQLRLIPFMDATRKHVGREYNYLNVLDEQDAPQKEKDEALDRIQELYDEFNKEFNQVSGMAASQNPGPLTRILQPQNLNEILEQ